MVEDLVKWFPSAFDDDFYTPYYCEVCGRECHGIGMPGQLCWECYHQALILARVFVAGMQLAITHRSVDMWVTGGDTEHGQAEGQAPRLALDARRGRRSQAVV